MKNIVDAFFTRRGERFEQPAAIYRDEATTYRELGRNVLRVARTVSAFGVEPGEVIGVCVERSPSLLTGLLGVLTAGGAYLPLEPDQPVRRTRAALDAARPRLIVTQSKLAARFEGVDAELVLVDGPEPDVKASLLAAESIDPDQRAYVMFTSGSSGTPKGVEVTHRALTNFLVAMQGLLGLSASDRMLAVTTVGFDISLLELLGPLFVGATVDIAERTTTADPRLLRARMETQPITVMQATPATWRMLVEAGWKGSDQLKVLCGGESMSLDLAQALLTRGGEVWNLYGPTECTIWCTTARVAGGLRPPPIGRAIDGLETAVLDDDMKPVEPGDVGELWIGGLGVALGYIGQPELTAERFVTNPFGEGGRWYRTGDLARQRGDGQLECLGRVDLQLKVRGFRVEPEEIETRLRRDPAVAEAVVVAEGDREDRRTLAAFVTGPDMDAIDIGRLRDQLRDELPAYMVPGRIMVLDRMPLTSSGKVDRNALPSARDVELQVRSAELPFNDVEVRVAALCAEVLGSPLISLEEDFFSLGGNSILAVELLGRVRKTFGREIPAGAFFENPTARRVAELIQSSGSLPRRAALVPLQRTGRGVPLFLVCGIHLYQALVRALGRDRAVHAVYIPDEIDLVAGPNRTPPVEVLADQYTSVIMQNRGEGPIMLGGFSFGGVVAYEIARQLRALGVDVPLLTLLDTFLPSAVRRDPVEWMAARLEGLTGLATAREKASKLIARLRPGMPSNSGELDSGDLESSDDALARRRNAVLTQRMREYERRMSPYDGTVLLLSCRNRPELRGFTLDSGLGWDGQLRGEVTTRSFDASHLELMKKPTVLEVAELMRRQLELIDRSAGLRAG